MNHRSPVALVALLLSLACVQSAAAASRTRLTVWHSRTSAASRQFFHDWHDDAAFRDRILARYELWQVDLDACVLVCPRVRIVPSFRAGPLLIEGYAGKAPFLQRLGLAPAPAPDWRPSTAPLNRDSPEERATGDASEDPAPPPPAPPDPPAAAAAENSGGALAAEDPAPDAAQPSQPLPPLPSLDRTQRREPDAVTTESTDAAADGRSADAPTPTLEATPEPAVSLRSWLRLALTIFNLAHPAGQAGTALTLAAGVVGWFVARRRSRTAAAAHCTRCTGYEQQLTKCRDECGRELTALRRRITELEAERDALASGKSCPACPGKDDRLRALEALTKDLRGELDLSRSQPQRDYVIKVDGTISSESWEWAYKQCLVKFEGTSEKKDAVRQLKALRDQHFSGEVAKRQLAKDA